MNLRTHDALTKIILMVFRLSGSLLERGNSLVKPLGLTSARWQVLGALATAEKPLTCPQIGTSMGISRQGTLKQLDLLEAEGFVETLENAHRQRSPLYNLTKRGRNKYRSAMTLQEHWVAELCQDLTRPELKTTADVLVKLSKRLE